MWNKSTITNLARISLLKYNHCQWVGKWRMDMMSSARVSRWRKNVFSFVSSSAPNKAFTIYGWKRAVHWCRWPKTEGVAVEGCVQHRHITRHLRRDPQESFWRFHEGKIRGCDVRQWQRNSWRWENLAMGIINFHGEHQEKGLNGNPNGVSWQPAWESF